MERWHTTAEVETYARRALPWLLRDPVRHNVLLTIVEHTRRGTASWGDDAIFAWHERDDGAVDGAASCTPPHKLCVPALDPPLAAALARTLYDAGRLLPGVTGPTDAARAFSDAWSALAGGAPARLATAQRLYRLDALTPAPPAPGGPRDAAERDVPLIARWMQGFTEEAGVVPVDYERWARTRLGTLLVWTDGETDVALVGHAPPVGRVARVGPVWTPPEHRRRGYATAAVAEMTRRLLAAGQSACALYTDLANPTSNSIYQKVGYYPVCDVHEYAFEA